MKNEMISIVIGLCFVSFQHHMYTAQLPNTERLKNLTVCDLNADFNLVCGTDEVIAVHSLQYAFDFRCDSICCDTYTNTDCFEDGDTGDIQELRRLCSGRTSCTVSSLKTQTGFCAYGVQSVSYIFLQYYCISETRISSVCASGVTLNSDGLPLYITNENYPEVTTGSTSCSCSLEVYSCSANINLYIIDADLFYDTSSCDQTIVFRDGTDGTVTTINCGNYYTNNIQVNPVSVHYTKIDFINNSTSNQEGLFFIGLKASDDTTAFSLSCGAQAESWCVDCSSVPGIQHGSAILDDPGNTTYGALATVTCNDGYEQTTEKIQCLASGSWESTTCNPIDCHSLPIIQYGYASLDVSGNSSYGALATVTCYRGYAKTTDKIQCLVSGSWENATCTVEDCGDLPTLQNGNVTLRDRSNTTYGALADVACIDGYSTDKVTISCLYTGEWEEVQDCADTTSTTQINTDKSKENDGNKINQTCIIVISVVGAIIFFVAVGLGCKFCKKKKDTAVSP